MRSSGTEDWNTSFAYCDVSMTCVSSLPQAWKAVFQVKDIKNGSLTIKFLQDVSLEFGCQVEKKDRSSPEWQLITINAAKCKLHHYL